jgi:integrase
MSQRYRVFRRGWGTFYCQDLTTGKQESLRTRDKTEAHRLVAARNEGDKAPAFSLQLARVYWRASDPAAGNRTWQAVMDEVLRQKAGPTHERWATAIKETALDTIRDLVVLETRPEHFLRALEHGGVSTNIYLRRIQNFALDMNWLPWPVLPKKRWPGVRFREKRAITWEEHDRIVAREPNAETRAFYELLWHIGGAQTDVASLTAENVAWQNRVISYRRLKSKSVCHLHFGDDVASILERLPREGPLFPRLAPMHEKHRAKEFHRRIRGLGIKGISLHSYRYAWAERARIAGMPERFAQESLGHGSKAVHRAYAKKAQVNLPSLEEYERRAVREKTIIQGQFNPTSKTTTLNPSSEAC